MRNKRPQLLAVTFTLLLCLDARLLASTIDLEVGNYFVTSQDHAIFASRNDATDKNAKPLQYLMHENRVSLESGAFRTGIHFSNRFFVEKTNSTSLTENPFALEKKHLTADWKDWSLVFGDSSQELGKGLALSLYQDDVFGVNNTLEGVSAKYNPRGFELLGFAGRINSLESPVAVNAVNDPLVGRTVWLFGSSIGGTVAENTKVGGHYMLALNQPDGFSVYNKTWTAIGVTAESSEFLPRTNAYTETNVLFAHINVAGADRELPRGWAHYSSLGYAAGPMKLRWEAKHYEDYNFEFRRPPTLEEDVVETVNTQNVSASKWLADYRWNEGKNSAFVSYLVGYDRDAAAPFHHGVTGQKWKLSPGWDTEWRVGYRTMPGRSWLAHGSVKAKVKTFKGQYAELGFRKQQTTTKLDLIPSLEDRNAVDFTYAFSEKLSTSLGYEYLAENDNEVGQHFANVGASYRVGKLSAKAMLGQTSGGTVCSGGVCRQVPAFSGALLETAYTF